MSDKNDSPQRAQRTQRKKTGTDPVFNLRPGSETGLQIGATPKHETLGGGTERITLGNGTGLARGQVLLGLLAASVLALMFFAGCMGKAPLQGSNRGHTAQGFDRTQLDQAIDLVGQLRYQEALSILGPMYKAMSQSQYMEPASEAGFWLGYCQEKLGVLGVCRETYQDVISRFPRTRHADLARQRLDSLMQP